MTKAKLYTVLYNGNLWTQIIDDLQSTDPWATGGMIFTSRAKAVAFRKDLRRYYRRCKLDIVEVTLLPVTRTVIQRG